MIIGSKLIRGKAVNKFAQK